ncbi:hypothetical protein [Saccharopolyspora phatthalungensis]|uniref:Uncharacterized protein n=1 Tax=Saccharopolyspora phatthalungensis TaxID=664693 RepID=A0A840Q2D1_9PSEU|nr:hypothetical protein [Saccharopolyspora phatthalungensis]MBB5152515.1 hypothetical protein [Saccharopolyspora phatthalungensis]
MAGLQRRQDRGVRMSVEDVDTGLVNAGAHRRALESKRRVLDAIDKLIEADPCEGMPGYQRFWDLRWVVFGFAAEYEDHPDFHDDYRFYQR